MPVPDFLRLLSKTLDELWYVKCWFSLMAQNSEVVTIVHTTGQTHFWGIFSLSHSDAGLAASSEDASGSFILQMRFTRRDSCIWQHQKNCQAPKANSTTSGGTDPDVSKSVRNSTMSSSATRRTTVRKKWGELKRSLYLVPSPPFPRVRFLSTRSTSSSVSFCPSFASHARMASKWASVLGFMEGGCSMSYHLTTRSTSLSSSLRPKLVSYLAISAWCSGRVGLRKKRIFRASSPETPAEGINFDSMSSPCS
mmetsp:Transcript_5028/g.14658  ORF Transcript_5028/g.14658 Transcript_5028/m.14658 type:complete len:252 (+) Transcript_5028:4961-5716(+)